MKKLSVDGKFGKNTKRRMQMWLGVEPHDGIVGPNTTKALQIKVHAGVDGEWGKETTRQLQKYLNQYSKSGKPKLKVDGAFGVKTKKELQRYLNQYFKAQIDAKTSGEKIADMAKKCAWPYGTAKSKYKYPGGSATADFKKAIAKAYPDRSKWGKQTRAGASCDVFVGTVIRASGIDTSFPRGLDGVVKHCAGSPKWNLTGIKSESKMKPGDIIYQTYSGGGHIFVYLGGGKIANAHYVGKSYGIVQKFSSTKPASKCKKYNVYRAR